MRDPCPYCKLPGVSYSRVDGQTGEVVRDIREHDCRAFAPKPFLDREPTDTSFIREARNTADGLARYRRSMRPRIDPALSEETVTCGHCRQVVSIRYAAWARHLETCR